MALSEWVGVRKFPRRVENANTPKFMCALFAGITISSLINLKLVPTKMQWLRPSHGASWLEETQPPGEQQINT